MRVTETMFRIIQGLVLIAILGVVGAVGYIFITTDADVEAKAAAQKASVTRFQASAFAYHSRVQFYDGVCEDAGATEAMTCTESEEAFAVELPLATGGYYCADSTGYKGTQQMSKGNSVQCNE